MNARLPTSQRTPYRFLAALWIYQRERFPLATYIPLVLVFSLSALAYAPEGLWTPPGEVLVSVLSVLVIFFVMRVADEFKDADDDARFRPLRPVPRGLVSLAELGGLAAGLITGLVVMHLLWSPDRLIHLAVVFAYLGFMSVEFGAPRWLKSHPLCYAASHMLILPLIAGYAAGSYAALAFLGLAYANGVVLEVGRKIRAPVDEETGVQTYSSLFGIRRAAIIWSAALLASAAIASTTIRNADLFTACAALIVIAAVVCLGVGRAFIRHPDGVTAGRIEVASGAWLLVTFFIVGLAAAIDAVVNRLI